MLRGVKVFLKRNIIQLIIAFICIIITIKQMSTPFLFEYNWLTEFLFKQLPSEHYLSEILDILENLAFAYYSGLIFYYIVEYFPARRKEKQALFFANEHLSKLSKNISCLIADLFFVAKLTYPDKKTGLLFKIPQMGLSFEEIYCNRDLYCGKPERMVEGSKCELIVPFVTIQEDCLSIISSIEKIKSHVYSNQLEDDITKILSILENNSFIQGIRRIEKEYLLQNGLALFGSCTLIDISEVLYVNHMLRQLPISSYRCELSLSTKEDKEEIEEVMERMRRDYPESTKRFEESLKRKNK